MSCIQSWKMHAVSETLYNSRCVQVAQQASVEVCTGKQFTQPVESHLLLFVQLGLPGVAHCSCSCRCTCINLSCLCTLVQSLRSWASPATAHSTECRSAVSWYCTKSSDMISDLVACCRWKIRGRPSNWVAMPRRASATLLLGSDQMHAAAVLLACTLLPFAFASHACAWRDSVMLC